MALAFLPLHVWDREFDSRLILALGLTSEGRNVILGDENNMRQMFGKSKNEFLFRSGFVSNGDRSKWDADVYLNGGSVALHDEEGVNNMHLKVNNDRNVRYLTLPENGSGWGLIGAFENYASEEKIKMCRQIAWSKIHKQFMIRSLKNKAARKEAENLIIEGSSIRFDMLGEFGRQLNKKKVAATKEVFSNFILVLDNFSTEVVINSRGEPTMADGLRFLGYKEEDIQEEINRFLKSIKTENKSREIFANIVIDIAAKNPSTVFIMRPHPVMDAKYWKIKMAHSSNIVVISGGNVQPWIYGASMTIHSGCTTGLEAIAADTLTIDISNLIPNRIPIIAEALVSHGNKRVDNLDELNSLIKTSTNQPAEIENKLTRDAFEYDEKTRTTEKMRSIFTKNSSIVQNKIIKGLSIANIADIYGRNSAMSKILEMNQETPFSQSQKELEVLNYARNIPPRKKSRYVTIKEVVSRTSDCLTLFADLGINLPKFKIQKISTNLFLFKRA